MNSAITDIYKGWTISVTAKDDQCSHFCFDITSSSGYSQHVSMVRLNDNEWWLELIL